MTNILVIAGCSLLLGDGFSESQCTRFLARWHIYIYIYICSVTIVEDVTGRRDVDVMPLKGYFNPSTFRQDMRGSGKAEPCLVVCVPAKKNGFTPGVLHAELMASRELRRAAHSHHGHVAEFARAINRIDPVRSASLHCQLQLAGLFEACHRTREAYRRQCDVRLRLCLARFAGYDVQTNELRWLLGGFVGRAAKQSRANHVPNPGLPRPIWAALPSQGQRRHLLSSGPSLRSLGLHQQEPSCCYSSSGKRLVAPWKPFHASTTL